MMVANIRGIMIIRIIRGSDIVGLFLNQDGQDFFRIDRMGGAS